MHSFRSTIEATCTEKLKQWSGNFPRGEGVSAAFRPGEGGMWTKVFQKFKCPGVAWEGGRGDVEASIWLEHNPVWLVL